MTLMATRLKMPMQWRAGWTTSGGARLPIFFPCAQCGQQDAVIYGYVADEKGKYVIRTSGPYAPTPDLYCQECWERTVEPLLAPSYEVQQQGRSATS
ncbi:MAG: hypothetical protein QOE90_1727 [Thermoplasmata archaeon]|nr:hypothetical protein [Thermoplasmata archaeon]